MAIQKYNIAKPEKYTDKQGQEKTMWHNVGTITEFHKQDGSTSRIVEIPAIGLKANAFIQEPKPYNAVPTATYAPKPAPMPPAPEIPIVEDYPGDPMNEIDTKQIPF